MSHLFRIHWKRLLSIGLITLFVVAALLILARDAQALLSQPFTLNPWLTALSFLVSYGGLVLAMWMWTQILVVFEQGSTWQQDFLIYAYSLLGVAVPGRIWSAVGRVVLYERQNIPGWRVAAASAVEFIVTGLAALLVFGITTAVSGLTSWWQNPIVAIIAISLVFLLLQPPIFNRLLQWVWQRSKQTEQLPTRLRYRDLILWIMVESVVIFIGGVATYILLQSFFSVSGTLLLPVTSAWAAAIVAGTFFFWLPSPVIRDGMMAVILAQVMPTATALLFAILARVWSIVSILLLAGFVWLLWRQKLPKVGDLAEKRP